jgi:hypothetical protein
MESPTSTAYNRLDEAHRAWHNALNGYHAVEDFRAAVNSAIQSYRNLTFVLQSQKSNLPGFESWYSKWQELMKNDEVLRALHTARTTVVHVEDLKFRSKAVATIKDWVDREQLSFAFNPLADTEQIAKGLYEVYAKGIPATPVARARMVFQFERTWIYEKLPNQELLEALAHTHQFFLRLLNSADLEFSLPAKTTYRTGNFCEAELTEEGTLKCMIATGIERSLFFGLEDGNIYTQRKEGKSSPSLADMEKAKKRYGDVWKSERIALMLKGVFDGGFPFDQVETLAKASIANLEKDKYLVPISFIFTNQEESPIMIPHVFTNQAQKILSMDGVAQEVLKNKATYVLNIAEIWIAEHTENDSEIAISCRKDKREAIQISVISADVGKNVIIPFHKEAGNIIFSEITVEDFKTDEEHNNFILLAIIKALKSVKP